MNLKEIEARLSAIKEEMDLEGADIEALSTEVDSLIEQRRSLIEQRKKDTLDVIAGAGKIIEEKEEEEKMPNTNEVRNSVEYGQAFIKGFKTGNYDECRALLTTNASGTVPVPEMLETEIKNAWEDCKFMSLVKKTSFKSTVSVGYEVSATGASVHVEGSAAPEEETLVWGKVTLTPKKIKKWITVSDEAIEGTTVDTLNELYREVAQRLVEEAEEVAITKVVASSLTATYTGATGVDTITMAAAELSGKAKKLTLVMNRRTYAEFKAAAKNNKYGVDPFDGIPVIFTDALKSYTAASSAEAYALVGDFGYGFQANFPNGIDSIQLKVDDMSLAEQDLVKVVGSQYIGMDVVAPKAICAIKKA